MDESITIVSCLLYCKKTGGKHSCAIVNEKILAAMIFTNSILLFYYGYGLKSRETRGLV